MNRLMHLSNCAVILQPDNISANQSHLLKDISGKAAIQGLSERLSGNSLVDMPSLLDDSDEFMLDLSGDCGGAAQIEL